MCWRNMHVQFHLLWIFAVKPFLDFNEKVKWEKYSKKKKKKKRKKEIQAVFHHDHFFFFSFYF